MPFHGHQRVGDRIEGPSALGGMVQAAQTLEVVGAPAAAGPTSSSTADALLLPADSSAALSARRNAAQAMSNPPPFDSPRRAFGRQPEELHIPVSSSAPRQQPHHQFAAPPDAPSGSNPSSSSITAPQSNPQHAQYAPSSSSNTLPGALQPGSTSRALPSSTGAASSALPTLPQLSTQSSQQPSTSRTVPINSHGNSRSSPPGYDQSKYKQYGNTAENSKYVSPPSTGYQPNTPQGAKYSPLGLADIRPHADLADLTMSPGSRNGEPQVPTNSNYLAPWPIYAVDWSKWPMATNGPFARKIAIGSYLEDNHNYVRLRLPLLRNRRS